MTDEGRPSEEFVGEQVIPVPGSADVRGMTRREPGLPRLFTWRGRQYAVIKVVRQWKQSGPCHTGGGEVYLRKHWYTILTATGERMTLYFERQARGRNSRKRWWLYTVAGGQAGNQETPTP